MKKTVLITGAARGIGLATAEIFAENHYNIVLLDRDAPALAAAGERLPDALRLSINIANPPLADRWRPRSKAISGAWIVW